MGITYYGNFFYSVVHSSANGIDYYSGITYNLMGNYFYLSTLDSNSEHSMRIWNVNHYLR